MFLGKEGLSKGKRGEPKGWGKKPPSCLGKPLRPVFWKRSEKVPATKHHQQREKRKIHKEQGCRASLWTKRSEKLRGEEFSIDFLNLWRGKGGSERCKRGRDVSKGTGEEA